MQNSTLYVQAIKQLLKTRGIKYIDLASALNMTESGIKKMLNAKDISLNRLQQISATLGLSLAQLLTHAEESAIPLVQLTVSQENFLLAKKSHLNVFWRFAVEKLSISRISNLEKMSADEVEEILEKMKQLQLIKKIKTKYLPLYQGKFRFAESSKLVKKLNKDWSLLTLDRALTRTSNSIHRLVTTRLAKKSYLEFQNRFEGFIQEIAHQSQLDEIHLNEVDLINSSALFCLVPKGVLDSAID